MTISASTNTNLVFTLTSTIMRGVFLLLSCLISAYLAQEWTQELRDLVLQIHNDYRRKTGACQMSKLEYDDALEGGAKAVAEKCTKNVLFHREFALLFVKGKEGGEAFVRSATTAWYDEREGYPSDNSSCHRHCHYTQMVWDRTTKLGCYIHQCGEESFYFVCAYSPRGNWHEQKPYKESCDSACAEGQTAEDGLCVGEPTNACTDRIPDCKALLEEIPCICQSRLYDMLKDCPKTCNFCGNGAAEVKRKADCPNECEDVFVKECKERAEKGKCEHDPASMVFHCRKSCGICWE